MPAETMALIEELSANLAPMEPPLSVPRYVAFLKANARFWQDNDQPKEGVHPGLQVFGKFSAPYSAELIDATADGISDEHTKAILPTDDPPPELAALIDEAQTLGDELDITLSSVLNDEVNEELDQAYAVAKARGDADNSTWTLAQALKDKAAIAVDLEPRLKDLGDYDEDLPGKANAIGIKLADMAKANSRSSAAIARRNVLVALAEKTIDQLERAAHYALRGAPEVLNALPTRAQFARRRRNRR
jgi:hypothetical protein